MKTIQVLILFILTVILTAPSLAMDLDTARANKSVTELPNGFLQANNDAAKALVEDINKKRKSFYEDIAKKNNIPVEQVGAQAAEKIKAEKKAP
ncbi:MAG: YdbL family protein [Bdellovibrionales bacterium]|nr:YdbL family protein [Bdellovibrionales bacterium]